MKNINMEIELKFKPKSPIIIQGFPGFGMVGTITTEFLIEHLKAKPIGKIWSDKLLPMVAIHDEKVLQPLEIYYAEDSNIVILHALSAVQGLEWKISDMILQLAKDLKAKEVISLEGVGAPGLMTENLFYYCNDEKHSSELSKIGLKPLKEGIVMGVTGALLLKTDKDFEGSFPLSCIFIETHSKLPDSKAAAKLIEVLDGYLGLEIDFKPLLNAAKKFEAKIKGLIEKTDKVKSICEEKEKLNYLG